MRHGLLALVFAGVAGIVFACSEQAASQSCRNVPDGGCPLAYGKACDDPACSAAYACMPDGTWLLDHTCPPRDGGSDGNVPPKDAGAKDVELDVPGAFGGPGCQSLEAPDCPYGTAALCTSGCCDCEDLFVCRDGGWDPYATCVDGSIVK